MLESSSVFEESDGSPQHPTTTQNGVSMSPIQELGNFAAKLGTAMVSADSSTKNDSNGNNGSRTLRSQRSQSFDDMPEQVRYMYI